MALGRQSSIRIILSTEERQSVEHWPRSTTLAAGLVRRGEDHSALGCGALALLRGPGYWCSTHRGPQVGETVSGRGAKGRLTTLTCCHHAP
jgi:hypothetical protein